uniref:WW domain containing adaptor with coiled-coil n=1 Tax=Mandrillus leucophaeus TaxID=9568 RepID=A0A2K5ZEF0_MANLE
MSLTSDASSPRSYVSPRISTPQTNTVPIKPLISTPPVSSQPKVSTPVVKQGPVSQSATQQPVTVMNLSLLEVFSAQVAREVLHLVPIILLIVVMHQMQQLYHRILLPDPRVH